MTRLILGALRPVAGRYLLSLVLLLLVAAFTALKAWAVQPVVDAYLAGTVSRSGLLLLALLVAAVFCAQALFDWLHLLASRAAGGRLSLRLRSRLFDRLLQQSLGYFDHRPSADLAARVVHDVGVFEDLAVNTAQSLARDVATMVFLLLVLVSKDWSLALSCFGVLLAVGWALQRTHHRIQRLGLEIQQSVAQLQRGLVEMVAGFDLVVGLGHQEDWGRRFEDAGDHHYDARMRSARARGAAHMTAAMLAGLGISAILLVTGRALLSGEISAGDFGSFLAAIYLLQTPALNIGQRATLLFQGIGAARRAFGILEDEVAVPEPTHPRIPETTGGTLVVENLWFRYGEEGAELRGLSFSIAPGEVVALVGESGSGKSTVAKLLMRFYDPDRGAIRLDGVPLSEIPRQYRYRVMTYVPQETFLFDETIEFNLRLGRPEATPEELEEALRTACLADFVAELPDGLATPVGERGRRLSGGQRQRLAIARALLTGPRILILDEATSALDTDLEDRVLENLTSLPAPRTLLVISHRPGVEARADRTLVLEDGRLVPSGTPSSGPEDRLRRPPGR